MRRSGRRYDGVAELQQLAKNGAALFQRQLRNTTFIQLSEAGS
jgi:hypothetical protein